MRIEPAPPPFDPIQWRVGQWERFEIPGKPHPQGRPRAVRRGKYASTHNRPIDNDWKSAARAVLFAQVDQRPLVAEGVPIELQIFSIFAMPTSRHRKRQPRSAEWHTKQGDGDNLAKAVMDAANGIVWHDDRQVSDLRVRKIIAAQGEPAKTVIKLRSLQGDGALLEAIREASA